MLILPIYDVIVLPYTKIYIQMDKLKDIDEKEIKSGNRILFLISKKMEQNAPLQIDLFYPIGVVGTIVEVNSNGFVIVETAERVVIQNIENVDGHIQLGLLKREDIFDLSKKDENIRLDKIKKSLTQFISQFTWGHFVKSFISGWNSISEVACFLSMWLSVDAYEKYSLLEEDSVNLRSSLIEKMIYEYIEMETVHNEALNHQENENKKIYREMAIKKQMDYLQKELDELHPENKNELSQFEKSINESFMNDDAKRECSKILNRMKNEGDNSPEYGMLYDYLDFMTHLSWEKETFKEIDMKKASSILEKDHYGLDKVKKRIIEGIAVGNLKKSFHGTILLFVGPPGTGKTSIGKSIADAMGRKYVRVSLGGIRDEADIRGHRRTYIGAMPGRIMNAIYKSGVSNPVMVLDEVDKLSTSYNGDPAAALLEVLDPEQNFSFTDHYMNVPYDLSDVVFVCTANSIDTIPEALLNRMEVIEFHGYTPITKFHIAKEHLIPNAYHEFGFHKKDLKITDGALKRLISDYTMESGVRALKRVIDSLFRKLAVELVSGTKKSLEVTAKTVDNYLDMKPIHHDKALVVKKPGIVTGLAWTKVGGEILFVESLFTKGKGRIIITGMLGDVMKESVQIAISLVKSMFPTKAHMFLENDLHIHVPEGAIHKDGPSAGITLTVSLVSLVTGIKIPSTVGMTGEVSLRGNVMPIGGLKEKLMAAERAGIKKVFIPKDNEYDLKDISKEILDKLDIVSVSTVKEVLKHLKLL